MEKYQHIITDSYSGYWDYLKQTIVTPHWGNYLYWLIGISLFVWALELICPWRKDQPTIRRDFWLDAFYMFFNVFLFSLIGYHALSNVFVALFTDFLTLFDIENVVAIEMSNLHISIQITIAFLLGDFIQWNIHRLLHSNPWLWRFHKVHHSVKEMGFAAHLRYHWIETIVYNTIQYIPLAMIGIGLSQIFWVGLVKTLIGHLNHANIDINYGPLKYIFNNPRMHIWHHSKVLPDGKNGVNYGISLSIWDYLFKTAWIPKSGRDIELGFDDVENFPKGFLGQIKAPFLRKK